MKLQHLNLNLISYGLGERFDRGRFKPVKNRAFVKPDGGLWASPVFSSYGWRDWCEAEHFNLEKLATSFIFRYGGKILRIDTLEDAKQMPWLLAGDYAFPDFETMTRTGVDAIWLSPEGERATRFSPPHSLYGWDCECVLVMNPNGILELPEANIGR